MEIISFVILHYKDLDITDNCVQSILKMDHQEKIRIVIVDNDINECDEKRAILIQRYKDDCNIKVLQIKENGGFSYANNIGYQYAKKQLGASCIVVLNNDIEFVQKDFIDRLEQIENRGKYYVVGPDVIRQSTGEHQNPMDTRVRTVEEAEYTIRMNRRALSMYFFIYPLLYLQFKYNERKKIRCNKSKKAYYAQEHENIVLFGACLIYMPDFVVKEDKAFSPETHFYYEEYILAYRCRENDYKVLYSPLLKVKHESGAATRTNFKQDKKRIRFILENTLESCKIYQSFVRRI